MKKIEKDKKIQKNIKNRKKKEKCSQKRKR